MKAGRTFLQSRAHTESTTAFVLRSFGRFRVCMYWARQRRHIAQRSTTLYASSVWLPKPFHCCTLTKTTAYACMQYAGRMHAWWHALSPVRTRSLSKGAIAVLPSMFKSNPNKIHMDACLTYAATRDTNALQCSFWSYIWSRAVDMIITWLSVSNCRCDVHSL
jgi:hypothetical protein